MGFLHTNAFLLVLLLCQAMGDLVRRSLQTPALRVHNFSVPMSDGQTLGTYLITLDDVAPGQANLAVTYQSVPYGPHTERGVAVEWAEDPFRKLQASNALLLQDTRGSTPGSGRFVGFHNVGDTADTIKWLRQQKWWNGVIFGYGCSAMGIVSYLGLLAGAHFQVVCFCNARCRFTGYRASRTWHIVARCRVLWEGVVFWRVVLCGVVWCCCAVLCCALLCCDVL